MKPGKSRHSALNIVKHYHPEVTRVLDAKNDAQVAVTKEDCRTSKSKKPDACAMAKAFEKSYDGAIISMSVAYLVKGGTAYRYTVPSSVQRELVSFDRSKLFAPGVYKLKAPHPSAALGTRYKGDGTVNKKKYMPMKSRNHKTQGIRVL